MYSTCSIGNEACSTNRKEPLVEDGLTNYNLYKDSRLYDKILSRHRHIFSLSSEACFSEAIHSLNPFLRFIWGCGIVLGVAITPGTKTVVFLFCVCAHSNVSSGGRKTTTNNTFSRFFFDFFPSQTDRAFFLCVCQGEWEAPSPSHSLGASHSREFLAVGGRHSLSLSHTLLFEYVCVCSAIRKKTKLDQNGGGHQHTMVSPYTTLSTTLTPIFLK